VGRVASPLPIGSTHEQEQQAASVTSTQLWPLLWS
jgi:hypothetical protein